MNNAGKKEKMGMAEKLIAFQKGEYQFPDKEIEGFYEEKHIIHRKPVSFFLELKKKGFKTKTIAQMYGISEMKVRKILKNPNIDKKYIVHEREMISLMESRIIHAKKIVDEDGHAIPSFDILSLYR
jgi:DNA invertase Pin-like site-specific DNA recombinase